jgi:uncharacterized protein YcfJ
MKTLIKIMTAAALVATSGLPIAAPADGATRHHYYGRTAYSHKVCRYSSGTTGLVAGGVGGAVVGSRLIGGGILGTAAGAVGGALAGRAIDRASTSHRRCYYTR